MDENKEYDPRKSLLQRTLTGLSEACSVSEIISALAKIALAQGLRRTSYNLSNALPVAEYEERQQ